jgi:Cyclin
MPSPPRPSADQGIKPPAQAPPDESDALPSDPTQLDVFNLSPLAALRLLTESVEDLLRQHMTAEAVAALPTPPRSLDPTPQASTGSQEEKGANNGGEESPKGTGSPRAHHHEDIPRSHKTPIGSPETHPTEHLTEGVNSPGLDISSNARSPSEEAAAVARAQERRTLRRLLARKFYSKAVPPIPLGDYLRRLHTYCPMSTAVYLTAGIYLERLVQRRPVRRIPRSKRKPGDVFEDDDDCEPMSPASDGDEAYHEARYGDSDSEDEDDFDEEPILLITPRTTHRLLLGALRVATKALEDLSYSHTRFAKVGGVSDKELTRLEVNFLFLVRFRLIVGPQRMQRGARRMRERCIAEQKE